MAFISYGGVEYTAIKDVNVLPIADFNKHTIYRIKDHEDNTRLFVRDAENENWISLNVPFDGSSINIDGAAGIVPGPDAGNQDNFLRGNGNWSPVFGTITDEVIDGRTNMDNPSFIISKVKRFYKVGEAATIKIPGTGNLIPGFAAVERGMVEITVGRRVTNAITVTEYVYDTEFTRRIYSRWGIFNFGHGEVPDAVDILGDVDFTAVTWYDWKIIAGFEDYTVATESANGANGLVPEPAAGSSTRVLSSNNGWTDLKENEAFVFEGSNPYENGTQGLVPEPDSVCRNRVLAGNGDWEIPFIGDENSSLYDLDGNDFLETYLSPVYDDVIASELSNTKRSKVVSFPAKALLAGWYFNGSCTLTMDIDKEIRCISLCEDLFINAVELTESIVIRRTCTLQDYDAKDPLVASSYTVTDWFIVSNQFQTGSIHDAGFGGLVPTPGIGPSSRILTANSSWSDIKTDNDLVFDGSTWTDHGTSGTVPGPLREEQDKVLTGAGIWKDPTISATTEDCYSLDNTVSLSGFKFSDWINRWVVPSIRTIEESPYIFAKRSETISVPAQMSFGGLNLYGTGTIDIAYDKNGDCISMHMDFIDNDKNKLDAHYHYERDGYILNWGTNGEHATIYSNWTWTDWKDYNASGETYNDYTKSTTSAAGEHGLVPAPTAGTATRVLTANGGWTELRGNTAYTMAGASSSAAGAAGYVPAPAAGKQRSYMRADGTWSLVNGIQSSNATSTYSDDEFCAAVARAADTLNNQETVTVTQYFYNGLPVERGGTVISTVHKYSSTTYYITQLFISYYDYIVYRRTGTNTPTSATGKIADDFGTNKNLSWYTQWKTCAPNAANWGGGSFNDELLKQDILRVATQMDFNYDQLFFARHQYNGLPVSGGGCVYTSVRRGDGGNYQITQLLVPYNTSGALYTRYGANTPTGGLTGKLADDFGDNRSISWSAWAAIAGAVKATSSNDGIVTKLPSSSPTTYWLRGDNSWQNLPKATSSADGVVTALPSSSQTGYWLRGDNSWNALPKATSSANGVVTNLPSSSQSTYWLRGDNTWQNLPTVSTSQKGIVASLPTSSATSKYLRGDNTWVTIPTAPSSGYSLSFTASTGWSRRSGSDACYIQGKFFIASIALTYSKAISSLDKIEVLTNLKVNGSTPSIVCSANALFYNSATGGSAFYVPAFFGASDCNIQPIKTITFTSSNVYIQFCGFLP